MERSVTHATFIIERNYPVAPHRVFAAFADPTKKRRWFAEADDQLVEEMEMDFRVGGFERKRFHVKAGFVCENNTVYRDIVPDRRIVFAYTMSCGGHCISSSQSTVELLPTAEGTNLIFTEQAAFFEGADGPKGREHGWGVLLDNLARALAN